MEYNSAIKKNEIMSFAATWMDLQIIILSKLSQKDKNHMLSPIRVPSHPTPKAWGAWSHPRNLEPKYTPLSVSVSFPDSLSLRLYHCLPLSLSVSLSPSLSVPPFLSSTHSVCQAWGHRLAGRRSFGPISQGDGTHPARSGQVSTGLPHGHLPPPYRARGHKPGDKAASQRPRNAVWPGVTG